MDKGAIKVQESSLVLSEVSQRELKFGLGVSLLMESATFFLGPRRTRCPIIKAWQFNLCSSERHKLHIKRTAPVISGGTGRGGGGSISFFFNFRNVKPPLVKQ